MLKTSGLSRKMDLGAKVNAAADLAGELAGVEGRWPASRGNAGEVAGGAGSGEVAGRRR